MLVFDQTINPSPIAIVILLVVVVVVQMLALIIRRSLMEFELYLVIVVGVLIILLIDQISAPFGLAIGALTVVMVNKVAAFAVDRIFKVVAFAGQLLLMFAVISVFAIFW